QNEGTRLGADGRAYEISGIALAGTGRRHLGSPRRSPAFYAFENDGLAGVRPRDQAGGGMRLRGKRALSSVARNSRPNSQSGLRARLQPEEEGIHAGVWV